MEKKISMMNRFIFSMNPKKYIYLFKEKISKAFIYILLLSVVLGAIQGIMSTVIISNMEKSVSLLLKEDNLKFEMKNGILDFKESPFKSEEGQTLLYIDTTKDIKDVDSLRSITVHKDEVTVLLRDGFMIKNGSDQKAFKYSEYGLDKININNDIVIKTLNKMNVIKYFIIPFVMIFKFIEILFYALIISLIGVVNNLITSKKMKYENIFNLSLYSVTLPAIISVIYPIGGITILIGGILLMFGISFINYYEFKNEQ